MTTSSAQSVEQTTNPLLEYFGTPRVPLTLTAEEQESISQIRSAAFEYMDTDPEFNEKFDSGGNGPKQRAKLNAFCSDATLRRYLVGQKGKVADAIKCLKDTLKWRLEYKPEDITWEDLKETADGGYTYFSGYDKEGFPIIYVKKREVLGDPVKNLRLYVYLFETVARCMPMGYEKIVLIFDFVKYSRENSVPLSVARELLGVMSNHYPESLKVAYMLNAPWIFNAFWTILSPFLDPVTKAKVQFTSATADESSNAILKTVDPNQLESRYGGRYPFAFDLEMYTNEFLAFVAKNNPP